MKNIFKQAYTIALSPRVSLNMLLAVLFAAAYALVVVLFPWDMISRGDFLDFENYAEYFEATKNVSRIELYGLSTLTQYFVEEVLWDVLVRTLIGVTGDATIALRVISYFVLFVWALFLFRRIPYGVALLFLLHPIVIDVAMSGIRNGLAWSLVIIGLSVRPKGVRAALFVVGSFIHSTTFVLLVLYYGMQLMARLLKGKTILIAAIGSGVVVGLALTIGSHLVLGALGDRRVGEDYLVGGGSLLQASIWGILALFQCLSGREYIRRNSFVIAVLAWYLTMNLLIPWSFRVWGAFMPVIAVSAFQLSADKRQVFLLLYGGYLIVWYLYWTKLFDYWYPV